MVLPGIDDVVVRQKHGNPSTVYLLGTPSAHDQFVLRTRDEAVSQAVAYAKHQHVRAWCAHATTPCSSARFEQKTWNLRDLRNGDIEEDERFDQPRLLTAHGSHGRNRQLTTAWERTRTASAFITASRCD